VDELRVMIVSDWLQANGERSTFPILCGYVVAEERDPFLGWCYRLRVPIWSPDMPLLLVPEDCCRDAPLSRTIGDAA